jgi:predicted glycosyltransferase
MFFIAIYDTSSTRELTKCLKFAKKLMGKHFIDPKKSKILIFGLRGAKLANLKSPPRLRHSIPLKSSSFSRISFLDQVFRH